MDSLLFAFLAGIIGGELATSLANNRPLAKEKWSHMFEQLKAYL